MSSADTIYALATPPGRSGVAVIRLSGARAFIALQELTGKPLPLPRLMQHAAFRAPQVIDRGLCVRFPGPASFTGEDVVELHLHGGIAVIRAIMEALAGLGLRPAEPGEFSRRAFLNGKMDLLEAEGIADLIDAETPAQQRQALRQIGGDLSRFIEELRTRVIRCLAYLEATIDFPEEQIPESVMSELAGNIRQIHGDIAAALADEERGERLRGGFNIVILGAPNTGKSSLLNALARRDAAIVSTRAGTTRDMIEVHLDMGGFPVILVDTAGLRDSDDEIEAEGIRRALDRARQADLKLVLFDGGQWPHQDAASTALLDASALAVVSKSDLMAVKPPGTLCLSTRTGEGMDALLAALQEHVTGYFSSGTPPLITRHRHRLFLSESRQHLEKSLKDIPLELTCEELRLAAQAIGKITGKIQVDEVLDVIFKSFCIGK